MKQTNNAIKFLMAQYRAIFRNANLKMFLAAATAAAAMAAPHASAAATNPDITTWKDIPVAGSEATELTGDQNKELDTLKITASGGANDINTTGFNLKLTSGTHSIVGKDGTKDEKWHSFTVSEDVASIITLSGDATNTSLAIGGANATDYVTVNIDTLNNEQGKVTITGSGDGALSTLNAKTITIGKDKDKSALVEVGAFGSLGGSSTTTLKINAGGELKFLETANEKSSASASGGVQLLDGKISVAAGGKGTVNGLTVTKGTIELGGDAQKSGGSLTVSGELMMNGGTVDLQANTNGGVLTVKGKTTLNNGAEIKVASGSVFTMQGDAEFASGTVKDNSVDADGKVSVGTVTGTRTIIISSADLKNLLAGTFDGSGSDAAAVLKVKLTDSGDAALDLEKAGIVGSDGSSKLVLKTNGVATVVGKNAEFKKAEFKSKTGYDFDTLTVGAGGKDGAFALNGGTVVTVHNGLTVAGSGDTSLTVSGSILNLNGASGTVSAKTITLNDAANDAKDLVTNINVDSGVWEVNNLTLTKGNVSVKNGATLNIKGKLDVANNSLGAVSANAGYVNIVDTDADLSLKKTESVKLENTAELTVKASDVFTKSNDGTVSLVADGTFIKNAVSGDATSTLNLTGFTGKLNDEQLKTLIGGIGFGGIVSGVEVETTKKDGVDISEISSGSDAYKNTVVSVGQEVTGAYSVEGVKLKEGTTELSIGSTTNAGSLTLNNPESGKFVVDSKGKVADVKLDNAKSGLVLAGSGEIGAINTTAAGSGSVTIGQLDKGGSVTVGEIGKAGAIAYLAVNENVSLTAKGDIKAQDFIFNGKELNAKDKTLTVGGADVSSVARVVEIMGDVDAKALDIVADQKKVTIAGGAHLTLDTLKANDSGTTIYVGQDGQEGKEAVLDVGALVLGGATLAVDPDYRKPAAIVFAKGFDDAHVKNDKDAGLLGGKFIVGQNSAVAVGFDSEADARLVLSEYLVNETSDGFADPSDPDAKAGLVANALVLNKQLSIGSKDGILVDPSAKNIDSSATKASDNQIDIKGKSSLVITDNVYTVAAGGKKEGAAITFTAASGKVNLDNTSTIILAGDFDEADNGIMLFEGSTSANNPTLTINGGDTVVVKSSNGLLSGKLDKTTRQLTAWNFQDDGKTFRDASAPATDMMLKKVKGAYKENAGKGYVGYDYLSALSKGTSAAGIDKLMHAATYAGAQQAAVASVTTMAEAVGGRVGAMGVEAASIAATGSQANGGVWVTPMYKSVDADGFAAQGTTYGSDIDLAGVTFGADTVNGNMRFGAAFNIGSGKAEGKGQGEGLKDDFDYYGFGIYSAMGFGNFALVGDASLNVISHDVEGYSGVEEFGTAKGKADTTAVTMGVTGQYTISNPAVDVTPHVGARFIRLDTDSYDINTAKGELGTTDFDVQNVFSIPLGVTLSKAFEMGGWSLAPSADLTITFNTGDTDVKSTTFVTGVESRGLTTEVLDEVTYGVAVGLGAQYGAFGTQIGINYTGSENTDSFGVNAQARYMF